MLTICICGGGPLSSVCNTRRQRPRPLRAPQDGAVWREPTLKRTTPPERNMIARRRGVLALGPQIPQQDMSGQAVRRFNGTGMVLESASALPQLGHFFSFGNENSFPILNRVHFSRKMESTCVNY
jgi:hypothetical protein